MGKIRIDKFMKLARLTKRRAVAQEMIEVGAVRLNGRQCKSSADLSEGAVLEIAYTARVLKVEVLCADEPLLKRPQSAVYKLIEERKVNPETKPW